MNNHTLNRCHLCQNRAKVTQKDLFDDRYGAKGLHSIITCLNCGYGQTKPGLTRSKIGYFYAKHYPLSTHTPDTVTRGAKVYMHPIKKWILGANNTAHHSTKQGESVLDIGSGSGISLLEIKALGGQPYGVEPDPTAQKLAKPLKLKVFQGFITDNPFPRTQFDLITASQVIEHEPNPLEFLLAIKGKLKPDGRAILSFPNHNALYRYIFGKRWLHWHVPYHLNFFTRKSFSLLAEQSGFEVTKLRTITPNEWTLLQVRMLFSDPVHGNASDIWQSAASSTKNQPKSRLMSRAAFALSRIFFFFITPINRLLDLIGSGESFLVELKPLP